MGGGTYTDEQLHPGAQPWNIAGAEWIELNRILRSTAPELTDRWLKETVTVPTVVQNFAQGVFLRLRQATSNTYTGDNWATTGLYTTDNFDSTSIVSNNGKITSGHHEDIEASDW